MVKIAVYGKGGIGKSTMSSNITAALTDKGYKVLQIGCDPKHDSTRLLLNGDIGDTMLSYMKDRKVSERRLEDVIRVGYGGCLCTEAGGPEPGVGCAGRGIISSFELLRELGAEDLGADITLYDVLGDVVCGGFAVPLRNEYADVIYIVSSGEFMSIYAANNILRGVGNYDPDRIGGIIFNARDVPGEAERIGRFSEAVGIPIVASFGRSPLFGEAEANGRTVVDMFPDSELAGRFRALCDDIVCGRRYHARYLDESELENVVLGRSISKRASASVQPPEIHGPVRTARKYVSRNVSRKEMLHGCAFSGAHSVCASITGLTTILHSPASCAQFTFQLVPSCNRRSAFLNTRPIRNYVDPSTECTFMDGDSMVFGGRSDLVTTLESAIGKGSDRIAVITSCPSGIIGDDVRGAIDSVGRRHPDVRIVLMEEDGNIKGDYMQGVIDAGIALSEGLSRDCGRTDSVNLVGVKTIATNCTDTIDLISSMLGSIGIRVNCCYPGCCDISDVERIGSARFNLMINPDTFTRCLCEHLEDRFGIPTLPSVVRPGLKGMESWIFDVAKEFGREKEAESLMEDVRREYEGYISSFRPVLEGKRFCMLSVTRDVHWVLEAAEAAGMIAERVVLGDRSDYTNDLRVEITGPNIYNIPDFDTEAERENFRRIDPDIVLCTSTLGTGLREMTLPTITDAGPLAGAEYIARVSRLMCAPAEEGWRKDVL
ncbi:MAG: nitrogenase component 1 [Candidatus Methanomethylophilaceae archaeon]